MLHQLPQTEQLAETKALKILQVNPVNFLKGKNGRNLLLNEEIEGESFRLVTEDGVSRIVNRKEMFEISQSKSLDLVLVNRDAKPPVVKLLDYLAFVRAREKVAYQAEKNSRNKNLQKLKSIVLKLKIDEHDLEWKVKKAKQWLLTGEKVQLIIKAPFDISETKLDIAKSLCEKFSLLVKEEGRAIDQLKPVSKTQYACTFSPDLPKKKLSS